MAEVSCHNKKLVLKDRRHVLILVHRHGGDKSAGGISRDMKYHNSPLPFLPVSPLRVARARKNSPVFFMALSVPSS